VLCEINHVACEAVTLAGIKAVKQLEDYAGTKNKRNEDKNFFACMLVENCCSRQIFCRRLRSLLPVMSLSGLCNNHL